MSLRSGFGISRLGLGLGLGRLGSRSWDGTGASGLRPWRAVCRAASFFSFLSLWVWLSRVLAIFLQKKVALSKWFKTQDTVYASLIEILNV